jgi:hypothetical protein
LSLQAMSLLPLNLVRLTPLLLVLLLLLLLQLLVMQLGLSHPSPGLGIGTFLLGGCFFPATFPSHTYFC